MAREKISKQDKLTMILGYIEKRDLSSRLYKKTEFLNIKLDIGQGNILK